MSRNYTKSKLVYGWGINDVDYNVHKYGVVDGRQKRVWSCPYYMKWYSMIQRCLDYKYQEKNPTYKNCTICNEWKYLSNFIKWVDGQPNRGWKKCQLDKDVLIGGNKHYSPETVVFISKGVNMFITDRCNGRGAYMLGVCYRPESKKSPYRSECCNPFGSSRYIGVFPTELEAHKAWQAKKHELACQLADIQEDERIASRLREMYAPDKDWTSK